MKQEESTVFCTTLRQLIQLQRHNTTNKGNAIQSQKIRIK